MSEEAAKLFALALALPDDEREELGQKLIDSVENDDGLPDDPEWRAELDRRLQSVADGTAELIPWELAREEMHTELERRRAARSSGAAS